MPKPIRVVVVDDSAFMRQLIAQTLAGEAGIEVAGVARDAYQARDLIKTTQPDVVTLDVEMPRMDGIEFLEKIMTLRPMPVVMVSTLTKEGSDATVRALDLGAVDCVCKPGSGDQVGLAAFCEDLIAKVRIASQARPRTRPRRPAPVVASAPANPRNLMIAVGASTGGVERILEILSQLPQECPPVVVTQHMGPAYLASFAARLDSLAQPEVRLAAEGDRLVPGRVLVAPGDRHLTVARAGGQLEARLTDAPPVSGHRPSVDVLFESVAKAAGPAAIGTILSGMGRDGAQGLLAMRAAGAYTIGEQESSCVVYGMPRAAKETGAVMVELPVERIAAEWLKLVETGTRPVAL